VLSSLHDGLGSSAVHAFASEELLAGRTLSPWLQGVSLIHLPPCGKLCAANDLQSHHTLMATIVTGNNTLFVAGGVAEGERVAWS
jgi:hypothetical protein